MEVDKTLRRVYLGQRMPMEGVETLRRVYLMVKQRGAGEASTSTADHGRACTELGDREQLSVRCAYQ